MSSSSSIINMSLVASSIPESVAAKGSMHCTLYYRPSQHAWEAFDVLNILNIVIY